MTVSHGQGPGVESDYTRLGGKPAVHAILDELVRRMAADFVTGFLFAGKDLDHIIMREVQLASAHLGARVGYSGRPLNKAHGKHPINAGHFRRRIAFLGTILERHEVPQDIAERWLAHDRRLEALVTNGTDCVEHP